MEAINKIFSIKILKDSIYFKIVFVLWALVHNLTAGQYITGYLSLPIIAWGGLLVLRNIFVKREYINKVTLFAIYGFLAAYVVTIVMNYNSNLVGNTKTLIWQFIMMFVLFLSETWKSKEEVIEDVLKIAKAIIFSTLIISLISVIMFFLNITYWVKRVDGKLIPQGYFYARLWGIYVDPNQASVISMISMLSSTMILMCKKDAKKILLIFNIVVQYIFMVLAASRGGAIAFVFAIIALGFLGIDYLLRHKVEKIFLRSVLSFILAVVLAIAALGCEAPVRGALVNIPNYASKVRNEISNSTGLQIGNVTENVNVDRDDLESSNGRVALWEDGFRLSKHSPVFGFGDRNIPVKAKELTPGSTLEKKTVHNGFIHMMLSGGIVAVIIMIVLILSLMVGAIRVFFSKMRYNKEYYIINILSINIGILLITSMFLTEIFYQNSFAATIFWIFLGNNAYLSYYYLKSHK